MRKRCPILSSLGILLVVVVPVCLAQLPEVPIEAIEALGITTGAPQKNGFVFIEGRYIPPPYTVSRRGNGIFINRIQVEQPVAWTVETLTPAVVPAPNKEEEPKKREAVKVSPFDDTPAPEFVVAETNAPAFSEETPEEPHEPPRVGRTLDSLFDEPAENVLPAEEKRELAAEKKAAPIVLTQKQKEELRQKLDITRSRFELGLAQGEIFFFNYKHSRLNGTYGTAKALFTVLPEALRYALSPQDLMDKLNQGGVYFLDMNACIDLYKNKLSFVALSDRRRAIKLSEEIKQQRNK
jgi:hypothetical protein